MATDRRSAAPRRTQERLDDHAAIDHLADELLPALVAKLGASGLGELEIREGTWRVRLRMPADASSVAGRRSASGRTGSRAGDGPHAARARADAPGAAGSGTGPDTQGPATESASGVGPSRLVATSPAVGYFRPRGDLRAGMKVRAGDRIGSVDVLGIGQDLVAPGDGLIGATLVAPGEPVEYGQAIIVLEQLSGPRLQPAGVAPADGSSDDPVGAGHAAELDALPADPIASDAVAIADAAPPTAGDADPDVAPYGAAPPTEAG